MKQFFPQPGHGPVSRAAARNAALANQLATPGLGSLMAGRWVAGIGQLILAVAGFVMVAVWFFEVMLQYYSQISGNGTSHAAGWLGIAGSILFVISWLWSLVTSVSLLLQAKAGETEATKPASPQTTDSHGPPPKLS